MTEIRLIHAADIHLGYTGNKNLVFGENDPNPGRYIREVDLEQSVQWLKKCLVQADPPVDVVVIAGDLFHSTVPAPRAVTTAARMIKRIVRKGIDIVIGHTPYIMCLTVELEQRKAGKPKPIKAN
jgi:DNA repair exonuclease SbcCD nuclease subunit